MKTFLSFSLLALGRLRAAKLHSPPELSRIDQHRDLITIIRDVKVNFTDEISGPHCF